MLFPKRRMQIDEQEFTPELTMKKIKRAIISVSNKSGLPELARCLQEHGVEIYSTGGTLKALHDEDVAAKSIESYTQFPEMLDGRVKTLHPKIHGGILAIRDNEDHMERIKEHNILEFDLVCINLYPFEEVIQKSDFSFEEAIENIDIGGPSMIRAAAKNYNDVAVLTDPSQYVTFIERMNENGGAVSQELRFDLAVQAFNRTGTYDSIISTYLNNIQGDSFPNSLNMSMAKKQELRYGENPHQKASFYSTALNRDLPWTCLHGKELSYNNLLDLDAALRVAVEFRDPTCAIFKHTNPCGISVGKSQVENFQDAMKTDPVSYFGGIVVFNTSVEVATAELLNKEFLEIIVAPSFDSKAFDILSSKKNIRLVEVPDMNELKLPAMEVKTSSFGFLVQENDRKIVGGEDLKIVSKEKPREGELEELLFAFQLVKTVKSNAIVLTKNRYALGIGAGQMSRVDSMQIAIEKAKRFNHEIKGAFLGSDAFFPFRDSIDLAAAEGVRGIIQPGGSIKDQEVIEAADEAGMIMAFTGIRHFKH